MTEKEKRNNGLLYDANYDKQLLIEMEKCKDLCFEFNNIKPSLADERNAMIIRIFGKAKSIMAVQSPFWCDYGYNIEVGENFYANHGLTILDGAKVIFGDNAFIGPNCGFYTAGHPVDYERRNNGLEYAYPITVGNNVWFGGGVSVMPGITIGNNVVVAGGSVVTKDIPDNAVVGGNPCKVIRFIDDYDKIKDYIYNKDKFLREKI